MINKIIKRLQPNVKLTLPFCIIILILGYLENDHTCLNDKENT